MKRKKGFQIGIKYLILIAYILRGSTCLESDFRIIVVMPEFSNEFEKSKERGV